MGIRTKFNPMGGENGKRYKAYIVNGTTYTDVAALGFTENINPDTTSTSVDYSASCPMYILNGKLFYLNPNTGALERIGNLDSWTHITGNLSTGAYSYGVADKKMYSLEIDYDDEIIVSQVTSTSANWSLLTGWGLGTNSYMNAIADGKLYRSNGGGISSIDTTDTWITAFTRVLSGAFTIALNSSNDLYKFTSFSNKTRFLTNVQKISICSGTSVQTSYAINVLGQLYYINTTSSGVTSGRIGSTTGWTDVCGFASSKGYGIRSGGLYSLSGTSTIATVDTSRNWTGITGASSGTSSFAYGIADDKLFCISNSGTVSAVGDLSPLKLYGGYWNYGFVVCEQ